MKLFKHNRYCYIRALVGILFVIIILSACKNNPQSPGVEYMPDMYRSENFRTYSTNPNFADSMTARMPVSGTVARGHMPYLFPNTLEGYIEAGNNLKNPLDSNTIYIAAGKDLFSKYCEHCHGASGNGDGLVVTNGNHPPPPSYSNGNSSRGGLMSNLSAGKIYHTIIYGLNTMGSHASQLTEEERWKIVLYVQQLQQMGNTNAAADTSNSSDTLIVLNNTDTLIKN